MLRRVLFAGVLLATGLLGFGQNLPAAKRMSNDDVIQLTKAGLAEETIVLAVRASLPGFDTSPQALISLKSAGVAKTVMDAIVEAATRRENAAPGVTGADAIPVDLPRELGLYYNGGNGWKRLLEASAAKHNMKRGFLTQVSGIGSIHVVLEYRGAHANCQIPREETNVLRSCR
jgi:hypothetical protein